MAFEQRILNLKVIWRGNEYLVEIASNATLEDFGQKLHELTNVRSGTIKLLVPGSKQCPKLLKPFSGEHSGLVLAEINIKEEKCVKMMGIFDTEKDEVSGSNRKTDLRIIGFDDEERRLKHRLHLGHQTLLKLPQGKFIFCNFRALDIPGFELDPPPSEALRRMHMLASDPGIIAIMNKHQWRIDLMTEMAPEGYVGISPKCLLGFNKNYGEEISLRLRTDDLKGFRKYASIKQTLLHELAHMVFSEHDSKFYAFNRQLNLEAVNLDWTKSKSHTLNGSWHSTHHEGELPDETIDLPRKIGGKIPEHSSTPCELSVSAAYNRLLSSLSGPEAVAVNHQSAPSLKNVPSNSDADSYLHMNSMLAHSIPDAVDNVSPKRSSIDGLHQFNAILDEPDPDDTRPVPVNQCVFQDASCVCKQKNDLESKPGGCTEIKTASVDHTSGIQSVDLLYVATSSECRESSIKTDEPGQHDILENSANGNEWMVSSENVGSTDWRSSSSEAFAVATDDLRAIEESISFISVCLQKAIDKIRSEVPAEGANLILRTLFKIVRNVLEHPGELKFQRFRKANPTFQRNVASHQAAVELLSIVGFREDVVSDELGRAEAYLILKRDDPGLLWLAKNSLEACGIV